MSDDAIGLTLLPGSRPSLDKKEVAHRHRTQPYAFCMIVWIDERTPLPPTSQAMGAEQEVPGLLAVGGGLSLQRLEEAYRHGVFPWFSEGQPTLWWAPDPRMVLWVDEFRMPRSLRQTLKRFVLDPACEIRVDTAFDQVIHACAQSARPGQEGTWILPEMIEAYVAWHRQGRVHSVETWVDGKLVGGLYAVSIGRMCFGESMFAGRPDASKIALAALVALCRERGMAMIDCQQNTSHLARFGAREIARTAFERHLDHAVAVQDWRPWTYHRRLWRHVLPGLPPLDEPRIDTP